MKKIYVRPETKAIEINLCSMLCASGVDSDYSDNPATENAKARFIDDWDEE